MHRLTRLTSAVAKRARGFTLIETLVAVLLLTTSIVGPLTLASKGLSATLIARDQMVAFNLAQDAIEYVRFVRDTNKLVGGSSDWLAGNGTGATKDLTPCLNTLGCQIDPTSGAIAVCPSPAGSCPVLKKNVSGSRVSFSYTSGTDMPNQMRRSLIITKPVASEAILTATVSWRSQSGVTRPGCPTGTQCVTVRENIFDWQ